LSAASTTEIPTGPVVRGAGPRHPADAVRWEAARSPARIGFDDVPVLTRLLGHYDPSVRAYAVFGLGNLGARAAPAVPAPAEALELPESDTRGGAATALAKIGPGAPMAVPALERVLQDEGGIPGLASAGIEDP
jgi:HEAT repeat protein